MRKGKIIIFIAFIFSTNLLLAQKQFRFGINYFGGCSTIMGNDISYLPKLSVGTGWEAEYGFTKHSCIALSTGYMQSGAKFNDEIDNGNNPSYKFSYWNVQVNYKYKFCADSSKLNYHFLIGAFENTLLSAASVNTYGSTNINDNVSSFDYGLTIGVGSECKFKMVGIYQLNIIASYGIKNIYTEMMNTNGFSGNNLFVGLKTACLLGKQKL